MKSKHVLCYVLAFGFAACNSDNSIGPVGSSTGGRTGAGGSSQITLGSGGVQGFDARASQPTFDAHCGAMATPIRQVPVDLLLVLDRSGSMTNKIEDEDPCDPASAPCNQRWNTLLAAMTKVLGNAPKSIAWGLKFFSTPGLPAASGGSPEGCVVSKAVEVPIGSDNANSITSTIAATSPNYNTPTRAAIETATHYLKSLNDGRAKYILLATDGQPNCSVHGEYATSPDLPATLDAIATAKALGIHVYVIGVGPSAANLAEMAVRGGTEKFYHALSPESLLSSLNTIAGLVASCAFALESAPPNPALLGVYLDKTLIPRDDPNGWTLGGKSEVLFQGQTCSRIRAGGYQFVDVLFGCPQNPPIIP